MSGNNTTTTKSSTTTATTAASLLPLKTPSATTQLAPQTPAAPTSQTLPIPAAPKPAARHGHVVPPATPESPSPAGGVTTVLGGTDNEATSTTAVTSGDGGQGVLQASPMGPSEGLKSGIPEVFRNTITISLRDPTSVEGQGVVSVATTKLEDKLELTRIAAMARDLYLAKGEEVRARTDWYRDGRGDVLVLKDAANAAREALAAHAADPDGCDAPTAPLRVPFGWIASIENDRCFLRCNGHFKGENIGGWQKLFANTTLTCAMGPPPAEFPRLVADYHAALATLRSLLPKGVNQQSGHVYQQIATPHLRLRHSVFQPKASDDDDDTNEDGVLPAEFTIEGWPTYSEAARQALLKIQDTHVARPLQAFDVHGNLIPPSRYLNELRGATVLAHFSVVAYKITDKRANGTEVVRTNVCLDIEYLRVLIAPAQVGGSRKRGPVHLTDPFASDAKRRRA